jgi:hypothetical protein
MEEIRTRLKLDMEPLSQIPDSYLSYAFVDNYIFEDFEFLGDAVYELVAHRFGYHERVIESYDSLRSNRDQACLFSRTGLCDDLPLTNQRGDYGKPCADRLEAIIGIVYSYLTAINHADPIQLIGEWLAELLDFSSVRRFFKDEGRVVCGPGYRFVETIRGFNA